MFLTRSEREVFSSLRTRISSSRLWILYFCPKDRMLRRRIPVIANNWMKLSFRFIAWDKNPNPFFEFSAAAPGVEEAEEEAMAINPPPQPRYRTEPLLFFLHSIQIARSVNLNNLLSEPCLLLFFKISGKINN